MTINDRNAKLKFTACSVIANPAKGQGKGKTPKGQGKGPGERKNPNLKPLSERATPTMAHGHKFFPGSSHKSPPSQKSPGRDNAKQGGGGPSSFAAVVKEDTGPAENPKEETDTQQKKAESLERLLATLAADNPLRENLENQFELL